jgi:hypothetical protein
MDKKKVVYIDSGIVFTNKEELNHVICRKMDGNGDDYVK